MFQFNKILKESDLNPNLWFFFPILISLIIFVSKSIDINFFITYFKGETGIIENTTFLILFISLCVCLSVLNKFAGIVEYTQASQNPSCPGNYDTRNIHSIYLCKWSPY